MCLCAHPSQRLQPRIDGVLTPDAWHGFCARTSAQAYLMGRAAYVPVRLHGAEASPCFELGTVDARTAAEVCELESA